MAPVKNETKLASRHELPRRTEMKYILYGRYGNGCDKAVRQFWMSLAALSFGLAVWLPSAAGAATQSFVQGYVVTSLDKKREIAIPQVSVFLIPESPTDKPVASALTDLSGRFMLKTDVKGVFKLCVKAEGYESSCPKRELALGTGINRRLGNVVISPRRADGMATLYGTAKLADGGIARGFQPALGINAYAKVSAASGSGFQISAVVNNLGEYVLPAVKTNTNLEVIAAVENESRKLKLDAATAIASNSSYRLDLQFDNAPPRIRLTSAMHGGKPAQVVALGDKVTLRAVAEDRDKDKLTYWWTLPDGTVQGPTPDPELIWAVPSAKGRHSVSVVIGDSRGGYVRDRVTVQVGVPGVTFAGQVLDINNAPISGAQVEVNGRILQTNSFGRFSYVVPPADRYVMNIRKLGLAAGEKVYGTGSYVYTGSVADGRWTLRPAQVFTVDPKLPIKIQHSRTEKDCAGPTSQSVDWTSYNQPGMVDWQDGRGNSLPTREVPKKLSSAQMQQALRVLQRVNPDVAGRWARLVGVQTRSEPEPIRCGPGIAVAIPANSLVNQRTGAAPPGKVQIALSTIELNAGQMPGDFSAVDASGKTVSMESFGAGSIEIGDGLSRYNLKPGASAQVTIPIDSTQQAGGAAVGVGIPFLRYDEATGRWMQDGQATRTGTGSATAYSKKVERFSTLNADILKSGQSCVAVELDPAAGFALPVNVEVTMPPSVVNPNVIQVRTFSVDSNKTNAVFNLPNNTNIAFTPYVNGTRPDGSTGLVPTGVFVVNTGGPMNSTTNPPTPNADGTYYREVGGVPQGPCASRVTLRNAAVPNLAPGLEFLQGLYFQSSNLTEIVASAPAVAAAIEQGAVDYYREADQRGARASLNLFKGKNRFGQPETATDKEYSATYANSGDLGFGREMHCRKNLAADGKFDVACYVTNYGQPPANNPDQQDADDAHARLGANATVAMEYSRVENASGVSPEFPDNDRAVKFYVYDTNAPDGPTVKKADLDGFGERPVPQLCMVCHGGNLASVAADPADPSGPKKGAFASRTDIVSMGAKFLPFDLHLFNFPAASSKAAQQAAFKNLNEDIVRVVSQDMGSAAAQITGVVDAWYAGGSSTQIEDAVVANWDGATPASNAHRFYRDVFGKACRTCHISRPFDAPAFDNKADYEAQIASVQNRVCRQRVMPHALRTNQVFWQSVGPSMPSFLQLYGQTLAGWDATSADSQCGLEYTPGRTVPSAFASQVYPILVNHCSSCHSVTGLANFAVAGGPAATYTSITTAIPKSGSGRYITPSNTGASLIFQRIIAGGSSRMPPPPNAAVPSGEVTTLQNWINTSAPGP
jgi:mono/diheme cytochrome c family protein/cytochrome c5